MATLRIDRPGRGGSALLLGASVAAVGAAAAVGGLAASRARPGLYETLDLPPWAPPAGVFSPVWTGLYATMAVAAWLVAREGPARRDVRVALGLFAAQLVLNAAWTPIFFGAERYTAAAVEIVVLALVLIATVAAFRRVRPLAAVLMLPYLAWVCFAAALNIAVAAAN